MNAFTDFHFLRPEWLLGLIPLALAAVMLLRQRLDTGRWRDAMDEELAGWLIESGWQGTARLGIAALLVGWSAAILALAGPAWEQRPQPVSRSDDALVVVLDLSLSMYAEDLTPSRLVRARLKIADVLEARKDGQTGLVVFAGDAHVVVPLTDDIRTINNLLPSLEPGVMPVLGSRPDYALEHAVDLLDEAQSETGRILMITDEIIDPTDVIAVVSNRYPVSVLGIGTEEGAPIPLGGIGRNGFLEAQGRMVVPRLDPGPLQALANATGGRYAAFTTSDADLRTLLGLRDLAEADDSDDRDREFDLWIDMGPWLLLLALPVALMCFRRGVVAGLALLLFIPTQDALAAGLTDYFVRPDQQAYRALREGRSEDAVAQFEDPAWQATALYRAEEYEAAARGFEGASADDHYNRGTALARSMKLEDARAAYDRTLELEPEHADALANRDIIDRLLAQQQEAENEQGSQEDNPNQDQDSESEASRRDEESQGQSGEQDQQNAEAGEGQQEDQQEMQESEGNEPEEGDQEGDQAEDDEMLAQRSREQEQALEQWLRRVPDEPGALLRRKFRYETDRRYRQGLRRAPQDTQPW